jgi:hypothetical protein
MMPIQPRLATKTVDLYKLPIHPCLFYGVEKSSLNVSSEKQGESLSSYC